MNICGKLRKALHACVSFLVISNTFTLNELFTASTNSEAITPDTFTTFNGRLDSSFNTAHFQSTQLLPCKVMLNYQTQ